MVLAHTPLTSPWVWRAHYEVWLLMIGAVVLYYLAIKRIGPRFMPPGEAPASRRQIASFLSGIAFLWIGADWPMHELSENSLFSVHMLQHFLFSLIAPALLLMGTPGWLARYLLRPRWVMAAMRRLTRPLPALVIFNAYIVLSHWPAFVALMVRNEAAHFAAHVVLVASALLMWWPVLSPMPELPRISPPAQMLYLFGQTIVPTVPASFLTFADVAFYEPYVTAPRVFAAIDPVTDQRIAGLIMKLGGGLLLWSIIAVLFFRWSSREETGTPDTVDWQDLERELNRIGPVTQ